MTHRRSRAAEAAQRATAPRADEPAAARSRARGLTRTDVEACARVFEELERLPAFEEEEVRTRACALAAFCARVEGGDVEDGARALALVVASRGAAWLAEHPGVVPRVQSLWDLEVIEACVLQFNARTRTSPEGRQAAALVEELRLLEGVLAAGGVAPGEAEDLAHAFVSYAHQWMRSHPGVLARYSGATGR